MALFRFVVKLFVAYRNNQHHHARAGRNQRNTMPPSDYFVFRTRGDEINITGTPDRAGPWINGFFDENGFSLPKRCSDCRRRRKQERY
ncbi:MAG: zinc-ribbon domain-containing protein [Defluviitaleaceae bacterium]|nr:zinc-ribbon domain-containing protein [Defluviitaleaceae bacterium]